MQLQRFLDSPRVIAYLERTPAGRSTLARNYSSLLVFKN